MLTAFPVRHPVERIKAANLEERMPRTQTIEFALKDRPEREQNTTDGSYLERVRSPMAPYSAHRPRRQFTFHNLVQPMILADTVRRFIVSSTTFHSTHHTLGPTSYGHYTTYWDTTSYSDNTHVSVSAH